MFLRTTFRLRQRTKLIKGINRLAMREPLTHMPERGIWQMINQPHTSLNHIIFLIF